MLIADSANVSHSSRLWSLDFKKALTREEVEPFGSIRYPCCVLQFGPSLDNYKGKYHK